jgi:dTDP-4-dehydrorhamnose reductase
VLFGKNKDSRVKYRMIKILIFGSRGMLGHMVSSYLFNTQKYSIFGSALHEHQLNSHYPVDVRNQDEVENYLRKIEPDIIINCIGVLVKESEANIENAIKINSLFPNLLSRLGLDLNFKLIHISTDCVFSGKDGNYSETSTPDGETTYARTKILGELIDNNNLIIRTSIIGPELKSKGSGLLNWFLHQNGHIFGYTKAFWTGVTTLELAKGIDTFINQDISGIYHFVPKEKISKYELLQLFKKNWQRDTVNITPKEEYKTDKSLLNERTDFKFPISSYEKMLYDLKKWMQTNSALYPEY